MVKKLKHPTRVLRLVMVTLKASNKTVDMPWIFTTYEGRVSTRPTGRCVALTLCWLKFSEQNLSLCHECHFQVQHVFWK